MLKLSLAFVYVPIVNMQQILVKRINVGFVNLVWDFLRAASMLERSLEIGFFFFFATALG